MATPSLEFLGVTGDEESSYRRLLRQGTAAGQECEHSDRLTALGLATRTPSGVLHPVAPARAVEGLIQAQLARLHEQLDQLVQADGIVDSLLKEREAAVMSTVAEDAPAVQQIVGMEAVRAVIDELTFFTRTENLTTNPVGLLSPESVTFSRPLDFRVLRRGVRMRTLMASPALECPTTLAYLRELSAMGAEIRISYEPLERMIICDRLAALTPVDPSDTSKGALLTREPGLVATLVALFERMWAAAKQLPTPDNELPSVLERKVLQTMYTADKDESGARELGISIRTYRKYVASLMVRLGATNRFQAALLAREHGWL